MLCAALTPTHLTITPATDCELPTILPLSPTPCLFPSEFPREKTGTDQVQGKVQPNSLSFVAITHAVTFLMERKRSLLLWKEIRFMLLSGRCDWRLWLQTTSHQSRCNKAHVCLGKLRTYCLKNKQLGLEVRSIFLKPTGLMLTRAPPRWNISVLAMAHLKVSRWAIKPCFSTVEHQPDLMGKDAFYSGMRKFCFAAL